MTKFDHSFKEIGHCGGQYTVTIKTVNGARKYALGMRNSRPVPAVTIGIYALPQGIPVGLIAFGGIGVPFSPPPCDGCLSIFLSSDSHGLFGMKCPRCAGYWRYEGISAIWTTTCPYCGLRSGGHEFLTEGQCAYIKGCCELIETASNAEADGEYTIDMDPVAEAVGKDGQKPPFYYVEEKQQNLYTCATCDDRNDILGKYGYCACCGTHNGLMEVEHEINGLRKTLGTTTDFSALVKSMVSCFDSYARQVAKQLALRVPMTASRKKEWENKLFHNLKKSADSFKAVFDIDLIKGLKKEDVDFVEMMFQRRHVYEHNGGEVDQKYLDATGDISVRLKQVIHESRESASRTADVVMKVARNLHEGFHEIFPADEKAVAVGQEQIQRRRKL